MHSSTSIRETLVSHIIESMKQETMPWRKYWRCGLPTRSNGEAYRGINTLLLLCVAINRGYRSNQWLTYNQAKALGGHVRKGSKSASVLYYKQGSTDTESEVTGEHEEKLFAVMKQYSVFNVAEIEGLPESYYKDTQDVEPDLACATARAFINAQSIELRLANNACYAPGENIVYMPAIHMFETQASYYATCLHELIHATGHQSRLNRDTVKNYKSSIGIRAEEEMVAEIGSMIVCAYLGILGEHIDNHMSYVKSWLDMLHSDPKWIFKAACQAQTAADWLIENYQSYQQQLAA